MSVTNTNTFISHIRDKLRQDLNDNYLIQRWFERIITIEFLIARGIFSIKEYKKEMVIQLCIKENAYFKNIFDDNIDELQENYPQHFYSEDIIKLLKKNINCETPIEEIINFQEDFKDHERYTNFKYTNRNSNVDVDENNITMVTQIFTPKWVAKYMAQNVIQVDSLEYNLIKEVDNDIDFKTCKILDPCLGTGNILLEIVEVLIKKYQNFGYKDLKDIIKSIYSKQLFGFDIDQSVINLSKFIFLMKAIEYCPNYLDGDDIVVPNFICIKEPRIKTSKLDEVNNLIEFLNNATLLGSLIQVPNYDYPKLIQMVEKEEEKEILKIAMFLNMKYDIVITNPPYMGRKVLPDIIFDYLNQNYRYANSELYTAFIERCFDFLSPCGYLSMLTLHTWMFIKSFRKLRKHILDNFQMKSLIHLGKNTFENLNAYNALSCAFVIKKKEPTEPTIFIKLTEYNTILDKQKGFFIDSNYYTILQKKFLQFTNFPFLYWLNDMEYTILIKEQKLGEIATIRQGLATGDNKNFIRWWYEVDPNSIGFNFGSVEDFLNSKMIYAPYNKGGDKTKWYTTSKFVIQFNLEAYKKLQQQGNHLPSKEYYFKKGITWSLFGFNSFNVRYKEEGYVFDVSGSSLFANDYLEKYILGYLSSDVAFFYLSVLAPTVNFQVGNIANLPVIVDTTKIEEINALVESLITKAKFLDSQDELSWNYHYHYVFKHYNNKISFMENIKNYQYKIETIYSMMQKEEEQLNNIYNHIYKMNFNHTNSSKYIKITHKHIIEDILSYLMGVVFNRYQLDNYCSSINGKEFNEIDVVIREIKQLIMNKMSINSIEQIEILLGRSIEEYFKNDYGKKHIIRYHNLPIYWYQVINNKQMIGYYHTIPNLEKEKGIRENYLKFPLQYKIKNI